MTTLAPTLQAFFTDRLSASARPARTPSPPTATRCRLLLPFAQRPTGKQPASSIIADLDATAHRCLPGPPRNRARQQRRTRNARLARSTRCSATPPCAPRARRGDRTCPRHPTQTLRPRPRHLPHRAPSSMRSSPAPTDAPGTGSRDHALILLAAQTGLRISELTDLICGDIHLDGGPHVSCLGKGRKQRITPLSSTPRPCCAPGSPSTPASPPTRCSPTRQGGRLSRDAIERPLAKHTTAATTNMPITQTKKITAHTMRHTAAMRLLSAGVDTTRHGSLARPRKRRNHPDLPPRRPRPQRTSPHPHHPTAHQTRPLPAPRHRPGLPRNPLIMPTPPPPTAAEVTQFVVAGCGCRGPGAGEEHGDGVAVAAAVPVPVRGGRGRLDGAVPAVAGCRDAGLPKALPAGQVAALLASCDRGRPAGGGTSRS